jgi:adenylate cyclase class 2
MAQGDEPVEVEVKARVDELAPVRERLTSMGFELAGKQTQTDTYYQHPARDFAETDEALRIRRTVDQARLTYKGPKLDAVTKSRREIDTQLTDVSAMASVLEALGFEAAGTVRKDRTVFARDPLTVTLDEVEGLGTFVEVEQVARTDIDATRERVREIADELGLSDYTRRSYLRLVLEKKKKAGREPRNEGAV